jgi:hypothetical protein
MSICCIFFMLAKFKCPSLLCQIQESSITKASFPCCRSHRFKWKRETSISSHNHYSYNIVHLFIIKYYCFAPSFGLHSINSHPNLELVALHLYISSHAEFPALECLYPILTLQVIVLSMLISPDSWDVIWLLQTLSTNHTLLSSKLAEWQA